jgi:queuine tRNA-ribosyltransferase
MAKEILAYRLNTIHNLYYYCHLMGEIRQAIRDERFMDYRKEFYKLQKGKQVD